MPGPTSNSTSLPVIDWDAWTLGELIAALDIPLTPDGAPATQVNLATRALAYALSLHGWPGQMVNRQQVHPSPTDLKKMGVDYSENCLVWKGEALNAAGGSFSKKMFGPGPVDERTYRGDQAFPSVIRRKRAQLLMDMCSRVEAFILRQGQDPSLGKSAPRPRL